MNRSPFFLNCLFSWLLLALCTNSSFGQAGSASLMAGYETTTNRLRLLPPNVASIERSGNVPVNFNTGQLNYGIPIHTIEVDNNVSIPIQLAYNNSGLKPDEVPTWVGNGWDLHVGGTIVQTINGMDDFDGTAGLQIQANRNDLNAYIQAGVPGGMSLTEQYQYCDAVVRNFKDSQFDTFSFNIPGKSGKFYFDKASDGSPKAVLYNQQPLRISFANNQFTITDEQGNVYAFTLSINGSEAYPNLPVLPDSDPPELRSKTWYLTKITTASGVEVIIDYANDSAYQLNITNNSCSTSPDGNGNYGTYQCGTQNSEMTVNQKLVSQISWKGKKVVFETIDRNDLYATGGVKAKALSRIKVYNENNDLVRQIGFDYDNRKRLQLQSLSFLNKTTSNKIQTYTFDYYGDAGNIAIPFLVGPSGTNSANNAIDHWGYYNGKLNTYKIPATDYTLLTPSRSQPLLATADRSSDGSYSLYGMLKRITFPTKGYTEITYEPNRIKYSSMVPVPTFMRDQNVLSGYTLLAQDALSDCSQQIKTGTFSIAQNLVGVRVSWELQGYNNPGNNNGSSFELTNPATSQILVSDGNSGYKTGSTRIDLPAGTYSYKLRVGCQTPQAGPSIPTPTPTDTSQTGAPAAPTLPPPFASFTAEKPVSGDITLAIGGNRVQKIVDYDQNKGYNERVITYNQTSLLNEPDYITSHGTPATVGQLSACYSLGETKVINERSIYNWDGFHVSYRQVTESFGQSGVNGQKTYTFDDTHYIGVSFRQAPFPPAQNIPWRTANLLTENSYRKNPDSSFELVAKSGTSYTSGRLSATANGKKIERTLACPNGSGVNAQFPNTYFNSITVPVFSDQFGVEIKTDEQWFGTNVLSHTTNYSYNDDWLVKEVSTINSKNQPEKVLTYYANDYENSASPHIGSLKTINAIGVPVKTIRTVNGQVVEGVLTRTDALGNPIELYRLDIEAPVTLTHDRNTFKPTGFNLFQSRQYSNKGNITQITPRNGPTRTYIWGYNHTYPIAEVVNATQSQVEGVGGVGSLESVANVMADASVQNIGSALRSGLTTSLVTSTVMQSGVGIKQLTGPSGLNTNYVYDGVNRLATISNNKNELVKEYTYNYRDANGGAGSNPPDGNQSPSSNGTISDQLATLNLAYTYTVPVSLFSDPENQNLTFTVTGLPTGLSYANNVISGTPTATGQSLVTLTATDPGGLSSSISFFLTVGTCLIADPYIVTGSFTSAVTISAVNRIETDAVQQVLVNPSASLTLKAGQSVRLKPGFVIKPGAAFRAYTGPCY